MPGGRPVRGMNVSEAAALDPRSSVSPTMLSIVKTRARQHLHHAVQDVRWARERVGGKSAEWLRSAEWHLGIAQGQVYVLYDTRAVAWRYQRAIDAVRVALRAEVERGNQE